MKKKISRYFNLMKIKVNKKQKNKIQKHVHKNQKIQKIPHTISSQNLQ